MLPDEARYQSFSGNKKDRREHTLEYVVQAEEEAH